MATLLPLALSEDCLKAPKPIAIFLPALTIEFPASSPIIKLPFAPESPEGIFIKYALSFVKSTDTSLKPLRLVAPPPMIVTGKLYC